MEENQKILYTKTIDILWDDMDAYGHVNNAKYFTYMQECRFDWLTELKIEFSPTSRAPVLGAANCKFIRPIVYPAKIAVDLYLAGKVGKKIIFSHTIRNANNPEQIYAIGEAEVVWFDFVTNKSIPEPEEYSHLSS